MRRGLHRCFSCLVLAGLIACTNQSNQGPSPVQTPKEELSSFQISSGLKIELVAAEPMVQDPVVITFDADGRLWVVEMRGFMADIDGTGETDKSGRVSVLEDTNGDGLMDKSTIYLDSLIMPRALALVRGGALIAENQSLWLTEDLNNDLQADSKVLIDSTYAGSALPEHSGNGLWRGMDNQYYNVKSRLRYGIENGRWRRDSTEFRGQWGLSHDDEGRLYYNYNWSQLHADLVPPNYLNRNKNHTPTTGIDHGLTTERRIYPIRPNPAVNRGYVPGTLDKDGRLLEFTAACSPFYYRGTALPKDYCGNVFVCEPSGNLIKRNLVTENGYSLSARDATPGSEFLASTDERFRPVYLASGPDGALYVADMYKGLIQHKAYVTPYLREQSLARKLDQPAHKGRIWRIVSKDWNPTGIEKLSAISSEELVQHLSHTNGWTRDMAQRLLVERNESASIPLLKETALHHKNHLGRLHALWTLQGLKVQDSDFLFQMLNDTNVVMRTSALRMLEPLSKGSSTVQSKLEKYLASRVGSAPPKEILQIALTANTLSEAPSQKILTAIINQYDTSALMRDAVLSGIQNKELSFLQNLVNSPGWNESSPGKEIFLELLVTAVARKRAPDELLSLLDQIEKARGSFGWQEKTMLNALAIQATQFAKKPIQLKSAPGILTRTDLNMDSTKLRTLSTMFEWPGHRAIAVVSAKNSLNEEQLAQFVAGRQHYLTTCAACHGADGAGLNRFAPPLANSEWVIGDARRLALIVLHGIEGSITVNGKSYSEPEILPVMPAHITLDDAALASILTYIRNEWGNNSGAVSRRTVGVARNRAQGRVQPWTVEQLEKYLLNSKDQE